MARTYAAAAFVKRNMPIGMHEKFPLGQGGLFDQEALDVAEYFAHQPRPEKAELEVLLGRSTAPWGWDCSMRANVFHGSIQLCRGSPAWRPWGRR